MKKLNLIVALAITALLSSCEPDVVIYDGAGGKSLVTFESTSYALPITIDATGFVDINVFVSTISSTERTFGLAVNNDATTIIPGSVTIPTTVTIPANSYEGTVRLNGTDIVGVETSAELLVLTVVADDVTAVGLPTIVSVFQVCPIPATFLIGAYTLTNLSGVIGPGNGTVNFAAGPVTLTAPTETTRVFNAAALPGFRPTPAVNTLNLVCNDITLLETGPNPGIACTAGLNIRYGPATTQSQYDLTDDSSIIITYDEDILGSCGGPFADQSFILIKI